MEPKDFINKIVKGWMYSDIQAAIKGNANFLVALGLTAYTEVMGGLLTGKLRDNKPGDNFKQFIMTFFPDEYKNLENDLWEKVRCGLAHEYFVKESDGKSPPIEYFQKIGKVTCNPKDPLSVDNYGLKCAMTKVENKIEVNVNQYFKDFQYAIEKYLKKVEEDRDLITNFRKIYPEDSKIGNNCSGSTTMLYGQLDNNKLN